jgi:hypothetical protein
MSVLVEEVGHYLDRTVNAVDTVGDEGQAFSEALLGYRASGSTGEDRGDDFVTIAYEGIDYDEVEANSSIPMAGDNFRPNLVLQGGLGLDTIDLSGAIDLADAAKFARSGGFGEFVNYVADPTGETLSSEYLSTKFSGFEDASFDQTSQETASVSDVSLMGVQDTTVSSGADFSMVYGVAANSAATTSSVADGVSAYGAGLSLGLEDSSFTAGAALNMIVSFGGRISADAQSVADAADAVAVGYGVGLDQIGLTAGSSLDLEIKDSSSVAAESFSTLGSVFAVASSDAIGATDLLAIGDSAVDAVFSLNLTNSATAITTEGGAEAVGWLGASALDDSSFSSGGIGLINIAATGLNAVSAESVSGPAIADAFSAMAGVNNTSFTFADTNSELAVNVASETRSTASSVLGNAFSNLTSTVLGLFGQGAQNQITGVHSVDALVADHGFAEAASVGGAASAHATQSVEALSGYNLSTTENLVLTGRSTLDSSAVASVVEA